MSSFLSFVKDNAIALMGMAYFLCLILSHVPGPVGVVAKWLVSGKLVKLPENPPSA